ncbi:MAG TPA: ParB/RepB/Spo0J family partition protein [Herpetosiphonaceae bacterium]
MRRTKNFVNRDARPQSATEADFEALFARHASARQTELGDIAVDRIRPNPFQARHTFSGIDELAQVIRAQGFTTRLRVRRDPGDPGAFQLVYGERRLRAAKQAGLTMIPCEIADHTDEELIEIGLAENIQRQDLDPLEEAQAFRTFMEQRGYTIVRLADRIGKDRSYVESRLALLRTPEDVQQMVAQRPDTIRAAREIAKLPTADERRPLIEGMLVGTLSKEDVRAIVRETGEAADEQAGRAGGRHPQPDHERRPDAAQELERRMERDRHTLRTITARWEKAASSASSVQRTRMLQLIEQHLVDLERLTETLRNPRSK